MKKNTISAANDVMIYGAGNMGKAAVKLIQNLGGRVCCLLDKNSLIHGSLIHGIPVKGPEMITEKEKKECDCLVAMTACSYKEIHSYLLQLGFTNVYLAGDYINERLECSIELTNYWRMSENELNKLLDSNIFKDPTSKIYYDYSAKWFTDRTESDISNHPISRDRYFPDFIKSILSKNEVMIDTGILNGEYIRQFSTLTSSHNKNFGFKLHPSDIIDEDIDQCAKIYECEPGEECKCTSSLRIGLMEPFTEFTEYNYETVSIDSMFINTPYSFLRVYSMSSVYPIIVGAMNTIKEYRPIIAANIGHYHNDFINVPILLNNTLENYDFLFRIHSFQGCDCILYALPQKEQIVRPNH
ncbi:MAG: nucleoside-diphosphate sugar epimerase/dehydratase [Oscillospiraceae bacterium]